MPSLTKTEIRFRNRFGIPLRKYKLGIKLTNLTKEAIESISKTIDSNGCWIPSEKCSDSIGYIQVSINGKRLLLHRIVLSIYYNINYDISEIDTRHGSNCNKACFNPDHLIPGTHSDNEKDKVRDGTHHHTRKTECPFCGSKYKIEIQKTGFNRGKIRRRCLTCNHKGRMKS